jgi:hypothetical protein
MLSEIGPHAHNGAIVSASDITEPAGRSIGCIPIEETIMISAVPSPNFFLLTSYFFLVHHCDTFRSGLHSSVHGYSRNPFTRHASRSIRFARNRFPTVALLTPPHPHPHQHPRYILRLHPLLHQHP